MEIKIVFSNKVKIMEILKTILYWIWKIVSYIFSSVWNIIAFVFGWIWDYIKLDSNTPKTASGNRDRRFKSTRELEKKDNSSGCVIFIILLLVFGIGKMCSHKKDKDVSSGHTDTTVVEKKKTGGKTKSKTKPSIHQNDKNADTAILPEASVPEDEVIEDSEIEESDALVDPISFDSINI